MSSTPSQPAGEPEKALSASEVAQPVGVHVIGPTDQTFAVMVEMFQGPLPHPELLANYERISPGAADRVIRMAELQGEHRRKSEAAVLAGDIRRALWGLASATIIGLGAIAATVWIAYLGHPASAAIFGTTGIGGLVALYLGSGSLGARRSLTSGVTRLSKGTSKSRP